MQWSGKCETRMEGASLMKQFQHVFVSLAIGDALKQEDGLGIAMQQIDVSKILAIFDSNIIQQIVHPESSMEFLKNCHMLPRAATRDNPQNIWKYYVQSCPKSEQSFERGIKEGIGK